MFKMSWISRVCLVSCLSCTTTHFIPFHPSPRDATSFSNSSAPYKQAHQALRLIVVGDTGERSPALLRVLGAIQKEKAVDYVVVTGDLVYPQGPNCSSGSLSSEEKRVLDGTLGLLRDHAPTGAKVVLALGNHDHRTHGLATANRDRSGEGCFVEYARDHGEGTLFFPAPAYLMDLGIARVSVLNTVRLTQQDIETTSGSFAAASTNVWRIVVAHHSPISFFDKEKDVIEEEAYPSFEGNFPDLWLAGHAHFLQLSEFTFPGTSQKATVVTSGSGSKLRWRTTCSASNPQGCTLPLLYSESVHGYAVIALEGPMATVEFKDAYGNVRHVHRATLQREASGAAPQLSTR